jgi:hypothetical protein
MQSTPSVSSRVTERAASRVVDLALGGGGVDDDSDGAVSVAWRLICF